MIIRMPVTALLMLSMLVSNSFAKEAEELLWDDMIPRAELEPKSALPAPDSGMDGSDNWVDDGLEFEDPENNTWVLNSDRSLANSQLEKLAEQAEEYLQRVVADHPHQVGARDMAFG